MDLEVPVGIKRLKNLFIFINITFAICGILCIANSQVFQGLFIHSIDFVAYTILSVPKLTTVIGVVTLASTLTGIYGAVRPNYQALTVFTTIICIIVVVHFSALLAALVTGPDVVQILHETMEGSMQQYQLQGQEGLTQLWDLHQYRFTCCGLKGYSDWGFTHFGMNESVPDSCCKLFAPKCGEKALVAGNVSDILFQAGCGSEFGDWTHRNYGWFITIYSIIFAVEVFSLVMAFFLSRFWRLRAHQHLA